MNKGTAWAHPRNSINLPECNVQVQSWPILSIHTKQGLDKKDDNEKKLCIGR